jgi:cyclic pyranopterin phosphate synthase
VKKINKKNPGGMVDISSKNFTKREAVASAKITMGVKAFGALMAGTSPKGDVFETAKVAGIMAAKQTPSIIPMCHPLELKKVSVDFQIDEGAKSVTVTAQVIVLGQTGVEMEALTCASVAALTIYDMMKWADKGMRIDEVVLRSKTGGKSGDYKYTP